MVGSFKNCALILKPSSHRINCIICPLTGNKTSLRIINHKWSFFVLYNIADSTLRCYIMWNWLVLCKSIGLLLIIGLCNLFLWISITHVSHVDSSLTIIIDKNIRVNIFDTSVMNLNINTEERTQKGQ
jgi:hypothetical protein